MLYINYGRNLYYVNDQLFMKLIVDEKDVGKFKIFLF